MSQRMWIYFVVSLGLLGIGTAFGFLLNNRLLAGSGEASQPISAPTLDPNIPPTLSNDHLSTLNAQLQAEVARLSTLVAAGASDETTPEAQITAVSGPRILYRISQDESQVRFSIFEELRGAPNTVVGVTNQVAADIIIDYGNPLLSQLGPVRVNMRTLQTDEPFRNDALRGRILSSAQDEFEFSDFLPTELRGLPETVAVGDVVQFQIVGDLTVRGVTRSVTFDATVTIVSEDRIEGLASTVVLYRDFGLQIPSVPIVANVGDEVTLEIQFVALRVEQ